MNMAEFSGILGNSQIKSVLKNSALNNKISHAYIFEGLEGSGKKLIANAFAKFIFCETKKEGCSCHSCVQFLSQNHSDLFYIRPEGKKSIGVEDMRNKILRDLNKKPFEYEQKIYIIENSELLTVQAQNSILRSIEEPPGYVIFIFLAEKLNNFLPTILSRCQLLKLKPLGTQYIYNHLRSLNLDETRAKIASEYSEGTIGKALKLYENEDFFQMRETVNKALVNLTTNNKDLEATFREMRKFESYKEYSSDFILIALMFLRDILAYKATNDSSVIFQKDYVQAIINSAKSFSFKDLYINVQNLNEFSKSLGANTTFVTALDALAIKWN